MNDPQLPEMFRQLGLSALLGLLVGLQREHVESKIAGLRTFPLIAVLGTLCGLLGMKFGGWVVVAGLISVATLLLIGNLAALRSDKSDAGITTEAATLLMYAVGAWLTAGPPLVAVAVAGGVAVLLQFKPQLHGFVQRLGAEDVNAIMRFVLIACIVLPVLPDKAYGPFRVANPFEIWLMVVLIVGISLAGYIASKFFGAQAGILLGGILGGAISSTATTVSSARRVAAQSVPARAAAIVILIATSVVYVRVLIEISVLSPRLLAAAAPPVLIMMFLAIAPALFLWRRRQEAEQSVTEQGPPADLKAAMLFGLMYAGVLLSLAAAKNWLGNRGLYFVAALSGLTDMDAITLSASRMAARGEFELATAWRLIVVAAMANLSFKAGLVAALGDRRLFATVAAAFLLSLGGGAALLFLWP